ARGSSGSPACTSPVAALTSASVPTRDIQDLTAAELEAWCVEAGEAPYRARQILAWVHRQGAARFDDMENLPKALRARLAAAFAIGRLEPAVVSEAVDGTRKLLFHLPPGPGAGGRAAAVESVPIPQVRRAGGGRERADVCIP